MIGPRAEVQRVSLIRTLAGFNYLGDYFDYEEWLREATANEKHTERWRPCVVINNIGFKVS